MTLIKSISGIRGTIGGSSEVNLTPLDVVRFTSAYAQWLTQTHKGKLTVVTGRDARISGAMVHSLVNQTLVGMGVNVIDLGLSTTPTVALLVPMEKAQGGIVLTASHNPKQWNALKLLNQDGEFIDAKAGEQVLNYAAKEEFTYAEVDHLGHIKPLSNAIEMHIADCLELKLVQTEQILQSNFKVVVDGVNSSGGIAIPALLEKLGIEVVELYCEPNGEFPHNPEPLKEHLKDLCNAVVEHQADFGIAVDPDVDRLVFVDEKGELFGEEYTLVACADYILGKTPGATVSNLSSTRALADVAKLHGQHYTASAVGEVNVVTEMKKTKAVIGGEGNGGVIYPDSHYGRDALVGVVLFLSLLVERKVSVSKLRASYPDYYMSKNKINLQQGMDVDGILKTLEGIYSDEKNTTVDGLKIDFEKAWVHLRKSNTEPIIRIYTEAQSQQAADQLVAQFAKEIQALF
ncbi:phosphoglucosamine mutase [Flavobacteriaceae bacterium]|nr:phosphoglucosamine mutase [Flavobacteriaceae bacterium]MDA8947553.1 phosphoglucosamine mutase [Flavobacteriaceae bacterium]MDB3862364.1 phosphoglucosamine mutase [Flavobacteriaceae bacterium]